VTERARTEGSAAAGLLRNLAVRQQHSRTLLVLAAPA
jgi:hypothetical protein